MTADPLGGLAARAPKEPLAQRLFTRPPTPSTRALLLLLGVCFGLQSWAGNWDSQDPLALFRLGSLYAPAVLDGDWWRLGSYAFLHIGPAHFLMNAYALWILMRPLEAMHGPAIPVSIFAATTIANDTSSAT